ncbi:helix-loop-helix domain-containing protein [Salmonella sp. s54412]
MPPEIANSKDLSELEILTLAMDYIKRLENVLDKDLSPKTPDVKG